VPTKKKKQSKISRFSTVSKKPEQIFKVVTKKQPVVKKKPLKKHKKFTLKTPLSKKTIIITIAIAVAIAGVVLSYAGKQMLDALHETERPTGSLELSSEAAANLKLLGSKSNYPNEIKNYQSAPADLQEYVLRDYTLHKANCIVTGNLLVACNMKL
jgi:hypothetical protein